MCARRAALCAHGVESTFWGLGFATGGAAAAWLRLWRCAPLACAVRFTNALYCYCARAYLVSASYASRILKEQSVWKRPVPFSEPGAALFLTICSVSSP